MYVCYFCITATFNVDVNMPLVNMHGCMLRPSIVCNSASYDREDQSLGASFVQQAPGMAGKLAEKVGGAAHIAAQAALGAASAMSDTVKAATGAS
jgi:hypothetical protein